MRIRILTLAVLTLTGISPGQNKESFAEPQSLLLFGGNPVVVGQSGNFAIPKLPRSLSGLNNPIKAISPDGTRIASSLMFLDDTGRGTCDPRLPECGPRVPRYKSVMGVYSLRDKEWKLYGDFCSAGSAAFSPDGREVAFEVETRFENLSVDIHFRWDRIS